MFYLVYYHEDKAILVEKNNDLIFKNQHEDQVGDTVSKLFPTRTIDDAGIERLEDITYEAIILYRSQEKIRVRCFQKKINSMKSRQTSEGSTFVSAMVQMGKEQIQREGPIGRRSASAGVMDVMREIVTEETSKPEKDGTNLKKAVKTTKRQLNTRKETSMVTVEETSVQPAKVSKKQLTFEGKDVRNKKLDVIARNMEVDTLEAEMMGSFWLGEQSKPQPTVNNFSSTVNPPVPSPTKSPIRSSARVNPPAPSPTKYPIRSSARVNPPAPSPASPSPTKSPIRSSASVNPPAPSPASPSPTKSPIRSSASVNPPAPSPASPSPTKSPIRSSASVNPPAPSPASPSPTKSPIRSSASVNPPAPSPASPSPIKSPIRSSASVNPPAPSPASPSPIKSPNRSSSRINPSTQAHATLAPRSLIPSASTSSSVHPMPLKYHSNISYSSPNTHFTSMSRSQPPMPSPSTPSTSFSPYPQYSFFNAQTTMPVTEFQSPQYSPCSSSGPYGSLLNDSAMEGMTSSCCCHCNNFRFEINYLLQTIHTLETDLQKLKNSRNCDEENNQENNQISNEEQRPASGEVLFNGYLEEQLQSLAMRKKSPGLAVALLFRKMFAPEETVGRSACGGKGRLSIDVVKKEKLIEIILRCFPEMTEARVTRKIADMLKPSRKI